MTKKGLLQTYLKQYQLFLMMLSIATVVLFTAVGHWNDWFTSYLYKSRSQNLTVLQFEITYNREMLKKFYFITTNLLLKMMSLRSQKKGYTWEGFRMMLKHYPLAQPKIYYSLYM